MYAQKQRRYGQACCAVTENPLMRVLTTPPPFRKTLKSAHPSWFMCTLATPPPRCINFDASLPTKNASLTLLCYRLSVSFDYVVMRSSRSIMCISQIFRPTTRWPLSHRPSSYACPEK